MEIYEVGGCVRDRLLGRVPKDIDYVVVGSSPFEMILHGFEAIDATFPIFVKDGCEYALARTEKKKSDGYRGFDVYYDPSVSLVEDLRRRDLTINAIAWDPETCTYVDPCGGIPDLIGRIARPVSTEAFIEDPLRVYRALRFVALYQLKMSDELISAIKHVVEGHELNTIAPERVFIELNKVVTTAPDAYSIYAYLMSVQRWISPPGFPSMDEMSSRPNVTIVSTGHNKLENWWHLARLLGPNGCIALDSVRAPRNTIKRVMVLHDLYVLITDRQINFTTCVSMVKALIGSIKRTSHEAIKWEDIVELMQCFPSVPSQWCTADALIDLRSAYDSVTSAEVADKVAAPHIGRAMNDLRTERMSVTMSDWWNRSGLSIS